MLIVLIPLPLFFAQTVFSKGGLTAWVIVGIVWTFLSVFGVVFYPLYESSGALAHIAKGVVKVDTTLDSGTFNSNASFGVGYFRHRWQVGHAKARNATSMTIRPIHLFNLGIDSRS